VGSDAVGRPKAWNAVPAHSKTETSTWNVAAPDHVRRATRQGRGQLQAVLMEMSMIFFHQADVHHFDDLSWII
jgi:hypothetical protein